MALLLLLIPASPAAAKSSLPTISRVSPLKVEIGAKLTIRGKNFIPRSEERRVGKECRL